MGAVLIDFVGCKMPQELAVALVYGNEVSAGVSIEQQTARGRQHACISLPFGQLRFADLSQTIFPVSISIALRTFFPASSWALGLPRLAADSLMTHFS